MVVLAGPVEFSMGSPPTEIGRSVDEVPHRQRIGRTFAIAAQDVTVRQFLEFRRGHRFYYKPTTPSADCPMGMVSWHGAALYCNWLSEREGIGPDQWCYETNARQLAVRQVAAGVLLALQGQPLHAAATAGPVAEVAGRQPEVVRMKPNYLALQGYRLPTEAEWEYACRAGAATAYAFGRSEDLLDRYGWYSANAGEHLHPGGTLRPNDFGLFDMHGNAWQWCQSVYKPFPGGDKPIDDTEDALNIKQQESRVMRGGGFNNVAWHLRSGYRHGLATPYRFGYSAFRPARTLAP